MFIDQFVMREMVFNEVAKFGVMKPSAGKVPKTVGADVSDKDSDNHI